MVKEIYILKVKGVIFNEGEENLKIFNSVAPTQIKNEDLPFDISWMTDWIVDWFGSLFNGGSDVIKDGGDKIDGAIYASVPAFFDVIFLILSVVTSFVFYF